jgi:protein subunit release factor A
MYNRIVKKTDLEITHIKGSGPGGQNRNKRMSGVRVRHLPTGIVAEATERRSQAQNLSAALERLSSKIEKHFYRPDPRYETKKTKSSQRERLQTKKKHSGIKKARSKTFGFDE